MLARAWAFEHYWAQFIHSNFRRSWKHKIEVPLKSRILWNGFSLTIFCGHSISSHPMWQDALIHIIERERERERERGDGAWRIEFSPFFWWHDRTRLPYEQFAAFLANVKQLNSRKQSKEVLSLSLFLSLSLSIDRSIGHNLISGC